MKLPLLLASALAGCAGSQAPALGPGISRSPNPTPSLAATPLAPPALDLETDAIVSASGLAHGYAADPATSERLYTGRLLLLVGDVECGLQDSDEGPFVTLHADGFASGVRSFLGPEAAGAGLVTGESVRLRCLGRGGSVVEDCAIVRRSGP